MGLDVLGEHLSPSLCREIREQLAERNLTLAAVDGTFNMIDPDEKRRWTNLGYLQQLIASCSALGTSIVTLCTGSRDEIMWRRHPDNDRPEAMTDLVAVMKAAARTAEEHRVTLAFEPEVNNVVNAPGKARQLIDEVGSSSVKVVMDPANIFKAGCRLPEVAATAGAAGCRTTSGRTRRDPCDEPCGSGHRRERASRLHLCPPDLRSAAGRARPSHRGRPGGVAAARRPREHHRGPRRPRPGKIGVAGTDAVLVRHPLGRAAAVGSPQDA